MKKALFALTALLAVSLLTFGQGPSEKPKIAGKWHFVLDTPGGDKESDTTLIVTDDKVSGKWGVTATEPGTDVTGTYTKEGHFDLSIPLASTEAGPGTMKISGQPADDGSLTGSWAFLDYNGSFKAKRVKEDAK